MAWLFPNQCRGLFPFPQMPSYCCDVSGLFSLPAIEPNENNDDEGMSDVSFPLVELPSVSLARNILDWIEPKTRAQHLLLDGYGSINMQNTVSRTGCVGISTTPSIVPWGVQLLFWSFGIHPKSVYVLYRRGNFTIFFHRNCRSFSIPYV